MANRQLVYTSRAIRETNKIYLVFYNKGLTKFTLIYQIIK